MLLVSPEVRAAFAARRRRDPRAAVAVESAAELHLGEPPTLPLRVATTREIALRDPYLRAVAAIDRAARTCEREGLRVTSLEQTFVDLLTRPAAAGAVARATALLSRPSALEERSFDVRAVTRLAAAHPQATTRRRVAFLLARAGLAAPVSAPARGAVPLDPVGRLAGAVVDGVRVNTADGLPDPTGRWGAALTTSAAAIDGPTFALLAWLVRAGVPLDAATLGAVPRLRALVDALAGHGLLTAEAGAWVPVPPFDPSAAARPRDGARLAAKLAGPAPLDAALVRAALGQLGDARRALARAPTTVDRARAVRLLPLTEGVATLGPVREGLLERLGRWADLRDELLARLRASRSRGPTLLALARACWRLGRVEESRAHLRALDRLRSPAPLARERALLEAALAVEAGRHDRAARELADLVRVAEEAGDESVRARALHRLGALAARRGRFVEAAAHYRAALETRTDDPAFEGLLRSNLAATALWSGRWEEAEREARAALSLRVRHGSPAEVLTTRVLLARVDRALDRPVPPEGRFARLAVDADAVGDVRLRVEAWLDLAEERVRSDDETGARGALERAHTALAALGGAEPVLGAMVAHVEGLVLALEAPAPAVARLAEAVRAHERQAGWFWAARAARDAATISERDGRVDEALRWLDHAHAACARGGFVLGEERTHLALTTRGAIEGSPSTRAACDAALRALGAARVVGELLRDGRADLAAAWQRRPIRDLSPRDRARLLRGVPHALVLDVAADHLVRPDGARVALGRRRVLGPLLRALGRRPGEPVAASTLIAEVWGTRDGRSARAALKMAISRLRDLLGPHGRAIAAGHRRGELTYGLLDLELVVLEQM